MVRVFRIRRKEQKPDPALGHFGTTLLPKYPAVIRDVVMRDVLKGVDLPIGAIGRLGGGKAGTEETEKRRGGDIPNAEGRAEARPQHRTPWGGPTRGYG